MSPDEENPGPRDDAVGYGKPPAHTRFRKGRSGNPGGRPRGITAGRATALALKELYRPVPVREGDKLITMPAIQAVLRSMIVLAAKGNCPAQRELIEIARALEQEHAAEMAADQEVQTNRPMPDLDTARRIAFVLTNAFKGQPEPDKLAANLLVKP